MEKLGGGSLLITGIFLVLVGALIWSGILNFIGFFVLIGGIIVGIIGLVKMFSGTKAGASDF